MFKRVFVFILAVLMLFSSCLADDNPMPVLNEEGFLDDGEYVFEDDEEGLWIYVSPTLKVVINRCTQKKPNQLWYEAEIWTKDDSFSLIPNDPEKPLSSQDYPYKIARRNQTVFAISTDFAQLRKTNKEKMGIIIRNGEVFSDETWEAGASKFPNLDVLALYPDGNMEVYNSDEHTAQEYLDMGVESTMAFGPVMIREGQLNTAALEKYGTSSAQRVCIGMVEKGHYFVMMLEGRRDDAKGAGVAFLAEKMHEKGCVLAFNLDGGQTASIVFMGHQLCQITELKRSSSRKSAEILGIGVSEKVRSEDDPW